MVDRSGGEGGVPPSRRRAGRQDAPASAAPAKPVPFGGGTIDEHESTSTDRLVAAGIDLRERFDPQIQRVTTLTQRTINLFPVRVWRHFLAQNGFILTSGMSYQSLFAIFAGIYVVFAIAGLWLIGSPAAMQAFVALVNTFAPGLIGPAGQGVISEDALTQIAEQSSGVVGWTGVIALGSFVWTAIGFVTYSRIAVRSMFGLPKDSRSYVLLKARDFLAALAFGLTLLVATALSIITTNFIDWGLGQLGWTTESGTTTFFVQAGALLVVFAIDTLALAALFRFLSGAAMPWRRMWVGSLLGSAGLTVIQLFSSVVLLFTNSNPLLATFAVFIGLLLWFRVTSIVILVAACWVAVEASDANESLRLVTPEQLEQERAQREYRALVTAARVQVRMSQQELDRSGWFGRLSASRALARAERALADLEASPPPGATKDVGPLP